MSKKVKKSKVKVCPGCDLCDVDLDEGNTFLEFTDEELIALWKKLKYKENPVWVSLRNQIEEVADICLHCGKPLDD